MTVDSVAPVQDFTTEQRQAISRRDGDLFLDAGAGSGKTSVLVERFARDVIDDGIDPRAILTITFTEKAAAEMRDRIRRRLRELGATETARAAEGAFISTIHGFCAGVLRVHALAAGIDPGFTVLDELDAARMADAAFDAALSDLVDNAPGALTLIAGYGRWDLRAAMGSIYEELRAHGQDEPRLPPIDGAPDLDPLRATVRDAAAAVYAELRSVTDPSARVLQALERLDRVDRVLSAAQPWPGDLDALRLPGGNGAALSSDACVGYMTALEALRGASAHLLAERAHPLLDQLLKGFGQRYERLKRERGGLDFEDLELLCRALLRDHAGLREGYRERFARVMVDELQDTNAVQLELVDMVARGNLFTVGDAQQSIYGFRHADVESFERRGEEMDRRGARLTLTTNFRSQPGILSVINRVFERELGDDFTPLVAGRKDVPAGDPRVELLVADREAEWTAEGLAAAWRVAEARALAHRVQELVADDISPADVVVLTRATTDLRAYERALEERGIPTYLIGGRGYWSHPQVVDLVAYLRVLANPRDEEALYTVLASPLVGVSPDGLVMLAAAGRDSGRDPWWVLRDPEDRLAHLPAADRDRMLGFAGWAGDERVVALRSGVEALIERVLERTGYDLAVLALPGGQRRMANVRKLMRLGRRHLSAHGPALRSFLDLVALRLSSSVSDPDASEAPVESEGLNAVRLMTIHRAKGLEFPVVCVADLGRGPRWGGELIRVGREGQLGMRLARPGTGRREAALAYEELGDAARMRGAREERRLFYVAMTRAQERLLLSGAARVDTWGVNGGGGTPMGWLGPALMSDLSAEEGVSDGVRYRVVRPPSEDGEAGGREESDLARFVPPIDVQDEPGRSGAGIVAPASPPDRGPGSAVGAVSYTSLAAYERCAYRFYVERVLGVPGTDRGRIGDAGEVGRAARAAGGEAAAASGEPSLDAAERGTLIHSLLERLDPRRPVLPRPEAVRAAAPREISSAEVQDVIELLERWTATALRERLGRATRVRREQRFVFLQDGLLIAGALDVIASEPANRTLIIDYKSDRLGPEDPAAVVKREYGGQRLIYALAALRAGAAAVEVAHVFLENPEIPVSVTFNREQEPELADALSRRTSGVREYGFPVTDTPHRGVCHGCPAEGGLCSWPLEMTRRQTPDRLF